MTAYSHGQSVRVLDCPDHRGKVGEVLDTYQNQVRIGFDDGTRCWPRRIEPADWQSIEPVNAIELPATPARVPGPE